MTSSAVHAPTETEFLDLVSPDSLLARTAGLWAYLPANGVAFLLQTMHPTIGDVVGKYSTYGSDPFGRAIRSIDSVNLWVYGESAAIEEGYRLRRLHQPLQMVDGEGKRISALNPAPYGWVIATGYAGAVWLWPHLFGRELTEYEQDSLFADTAKVARIVQVPESAFPSSRREFWTYFDDMVATTLVNHPVTQDLIGSLMTEQGPVPRHLPRGLHRPWAPVGKLIGRSEYLLSIGLLPQNVRDILGLEWTDREAAAAKALWTAVRLGSRHLPDRLRYTPVAYHTLRRAAAIDAIKHRARSSFTS